MKLKRFLALLSGAMLGVTGVLFPGVAQAQFAVTLQAPPKLERATNQRIIVRNVQASLMAWWLDPAHQTPPIQIQSARENAKLFPALTAPTGLPLGVQVPALSTGINRIVAFDPQNALLVFGTEVGFQELQKTVESLDKLLRQIEVEAQFVQIAAADLAALQIDFGAAQPGQPDVGFPRGNTQAILNALVAANKAKIITAPRITAIDTLPAVLKSVQSTPVVVGIRGENGEFNGLLAPKAEQFPLFLNMTLQLGVVPTLNADDSMTLLFASWRPVQLSTSTDRDAPQIYLGNSGQTQSVSKIKDGQTVAFKGVDKRLFNLWQEETAPHSEVIVLVTARIVRRVEDDAVKTVTLTKLSL